MEDEEEERLEAAAAAEEARRRQEDEEDENMLLDAEERALFEETEANLRAEVTMISYYPSTHLVSV